MAVVNPTNVRARDSIHTVKSPELTSALLRNLLELRKGERLAFPGSPSP